jgi:hypothetical protein
MADEATTQKIDDELTRLRAQIDAAERRLRDDAARIIRLVEEDFPAYLGREIKARFVSAPEFAEDMAPETLGSLKREIEDEGKKAAVEIAGALQDPALWIVDIDPPDGRPFDLVDLPEVWQRATRIDGVLERLLTKYRFPSDGPGGFRVDYKAPTWFVSGTLLKTLLETYRAHLKERFGLRRAVDKLEVERRTKRLTLKWDGAP